MKVAIHAVGRMKAGPEKDLADRYLDRFSKSGGPLGLDFSGVTEIAESRAQNVDERRREEADRLRAQMASGTALVLLDERGKNLSSQQFADKIAGLRDGGQRGLMIAIGGPDGHDEALRNEAQLLISFGAATWPHQMVRIMLGEQLYRAATILSGHPYHRA
ncbi:23S rRNA (pseudouridine(1915)-N(3))-methyltransferase RlmH [Aminobacter aganoensis]|uniref:Ribosomal RNA large subunit methyltransferase H n=1 Tax=Aminobacter aganoensis TaxID=83264 RepID=A0A7X0FAG2_9HYPH|nr:MULTISPECIES: 23S rRNA (pseudouridine(1915)-N(3))-methyltransferase RlmH [Aminobacter]KQU73017.1 50S rRNA methyltransferase [Aminobacter sp. DSM 101952]MBB6356035.1 23S rRNA (pseudouridine1915-N3)-methyltransferase [Aminobacter aganoensis]